MQNNVGLIYVSNVKADDVGLFNSLLNLSNTQTNILSIQSPSDVDSTTIEIYSNGKDSDAGSGDFIGGSFLSIVNLDSESIQNESILEIFRSISTEPLAIKELAPNNYLVVLEPGQGIDEKTRGTITSIVKNTSTRDDIRNVIEDAMVMIASDENVSVEVAGTTPAALKMYKAPTEKPAGTDTPPVDIESIVKIVYEQVVAQLISNASDLNATVLELGKNKEELTNNIVDVVVRKASEKLEKVAPTSLPEGMGVATPEPVETPPIVQPNVALENVITSIETPTEDVSQKTIYNDKVTIKSLYEGGCESDEELFKKVLENKDKLSKDELESACHFNMFEYYKHDNKEHNSTRESMIRKIKAGL